MFIDPFLLRLTDFRLTLFVWSVSIYRDQLSLRVLSSKRIVVDNLGFVALDNFHGEIPVVVEIRGIQFFIAFWAMAMNSVVSAVEVIGQIKHAKISTRKQALYLSLPAARGQSGGGVMLRLVEAGN